MSGFHVFLLILAFLALVGGVFNFVVYIGLLSQPEVSRTHHMCSGCFIVIQPGDRIDRDPLGNPRHIGCP